MSVNSALFHTLCPYIHLGRAGQGDRGRMSESPQRSTLPCSPCAVCQNALAQAARGSADLWQRSRRWQGAMPPPKAAPSMASKSWKLILWLFWISRQLPSVHDKLLISIWGHRLSSALPVSLILEKSKIRIYNSSHYNGLINLSGLQIVSR